MLWSALTWWDPHFLHTLLSSAFHCLLQHSAILFPRILLKKITVMHNCIVHSRNFLQDPLRHHYKALKYSFYTKTVCPGILTDYIKILMDPNHPFLSSHTVHPLPQAWPLRKWADLPFSLRSMGRLCRDGAVFTMGNNRQTQLCLINRWCPWLWGKLESHPGFRTPFALRFLSNLYLVVGV